MLPHDKALHLIGGVILFAVGHFFFGSAVGIGLAVVVGLLKEIWDWYSKTGTPDGLDFVATASTVRAVAYDGARFVSLTNSTNPGVYSANIDRGDFVGLHFTVRSFADFLDTSDATSVLYVRIK